LIVANDRWRVVTELVRARWQAHSDRFDAERWRANPVRFVSGNDVRI
jgi:hypothetical protein